MCSHLSQNGETYRAVQVSYHTHIPEYIPKYTWKGFVGPMWRVIRFNILMADLTLVPSKTMKVHPFSLPPVLAMRGVLSCMHEQDLEGPCGKSSASMSSWRISPWSPQNDVKVCTPVVFLPCTIHLDGFYGP